MCDIPVPHRPGLTKQECWHDWSSPALLDLEHGYGYSYDSGGGGSGGGVIGGHIANYNTATIDGGEV